MAPPHPSTVTPATLSTPTLLSADSDARRLAIALYHLSSSAHGIAADCERMLESLHQPERSAWRDAVGEALLASRLLVAIAKHPFEAADRSHVTHQIASLGGRIKEPRERIVKAMNTLLLQFVPVSPEEELLLHDARTVRDAANELTTLRELPTSKAGSSVITREVPAQSADPDAPRPATILVADDDARLRDLLARLLKKEGHEVITANDGVAALDIAQRESVDLVLTDLDMPQMDGMTLLRELKSNDSTRDIPVIVISGRDDRTSVATCIEQGAEDHIPKPYEPMVLHARVRTTLERKRMRDVERDYLARVARLIGAAEAVEREAYVVGSLDALVKRGDELGRLAHTFDRMVAGMRTREERLQRRLHQLRAEMADSVANAISAATASAESPFASGEILAGRYEILGHLGKGGMGMVYHARDRELGEEIAVKVVRHDLIAADATLVERLKSEIRMARKISHVNVVRAHDLGEWNGTYFITMEYVRGIPLSELLDRRGRLTVDSTLAIGTQITDALSVAHEQNIIHRDIKPANLHIDEAGALKVMDFGLARPVQRGGDANLTMAGFIVGTPQYMAPEQLMGGDVDARSDLFSVGVVLYECLAGRPPFDADSPVRLAAQMVDGHLRPIIDVVPDVPVRLAVTIHQLLQLHPEDRPASARDLANTLAEIEHSVPES